MQTAGQGLSTWAVALLVSVAGLQACGGKSTGEPSASDSAGAGLPGDGASSEAAVCTWPSAFDAPDPASGICTAARAQLSCQGSNGNTELCLSDSFSACPDSGAGVEVPNAVCKSLCKAGEYALSCGGVGPNAPGSSPPPACTVAFAGPGGPINYCCPCGTGDGGACAPLGAVTSAVQLVQSEIIAAGSAADGTEYVLTEHDGSMRLFVSEGFGLAEEFEAGAGEGVAGSVQFWTFQYVDQQTVTVEVQKDASGLRMGVATGAISGKGFDVGTQGVVLTVLDPADLGPTSVRSTQTFHVEYAGAAADGTNVVVIAPDHAATNDGFRVFLGPLGALQEQVVSNISRGLSIPVNNEIQITANGSSAELSYTAGSGSAILMSATQDEEFSGPAVPSAPAAASFLCR